MTPSSFLHKWWANFPRIFLNVVNLSKIVTTFTMGITTDAKDELVFKVRESRPRSVENGSCFGFVFNSSAKALI